MKPLNCLSDEELVDAYKGRAVLVTGANGFVASYLIPRLIRLGAVVYGVGLSEKPRSQGYSYTRCNLVFADEVSRCLDKVHPDFVFHLASQSSVGSSWGREWETIETNVKSTYNILKGAEKIAGPVKLLLVSSGEVYGDLGRKKSVESDSLRPINPYSTSKAMMEMVAHRFQGTNISYVIARPYNHTGPGRPEIYFESSVAKQYADAKKAGLKSVTLHVGKIDNYRDYSDVRDIIEKYLLLASVGKSGDIYNVCSGEGTTLREIIAMIENISNIQAGIHVDPARLRKSDIAYLVGESRIHGKTTSLLETMRALYESFLNVTEILPAR